jgi:hypothetical protein
MVRASRVILMLALAAGTLDAQAALGGEPAADAASGAGVFVSRDFGRTWTRLHERGGD